MEWINKKGEVTVHGEKMLHICGGHPTGPKKKSTKQLQLSLLKFSLVQAQCLYILLQLFTFQFISILQKNLFYLKLFPIFFQLINIISIKIE